jgi:predicted metal-dependent peptidase
MSKAMKMLIPKAKTQIITRHAFFSSILLKRPLGLMDHGTARMHRNGKIEINLAWCESVGLTVGNMVYLLCHECMHYMFMHTWRRGNRDPMLWNMATDAVINETLIHMQVGDMIKGGVRWKGAENMSAEEVYDAMLKEMGGKLPEGGMPAEGQGSGDGTGGQVPAMGGIGRDLCETGEDGGEDGDKEDDGMSSSKQPTEAEIKGQEAELKVEIAQARNAAKQIGQLHGLMERLVEDILTVPTPWHEYMERFFTRSVDNDYSFSKCDRRFIHQRVWLPGLDGHGMGKAGIIVDVSGSINQRELTEFSGNINKILESCQPEKTIVAYCHTQVVGTPDEYGPDEFPIRLKCSESGGTNMVSAINWFMRHHPDVDALVVLTDGYTPFGEDPGIPVFWAMTTDVESPYGDCVRLELNDER